MNQDHFGMDTITLAGPIEARLRAVREGGFTQIMLSARDLVEHPGGEAAAISAVRRSGLRVTGFQVLRDFEGLPGHLHAYKLDIAKAMLGMCRALGSKILLACSSTSTHASGDPEALSRDLRKLATLAVPLGIRVAYEALSWGKHVNEFPRAWEIVAGADRANLGLALDSFHMLATKTGLGELDRTAGAPPLRNRLERSLQVPRLRSSPPARRAALRRAPAQSLCGGRDDAVVPSGVRGLQAAGAAASGPLGNARERARPGEPRARGAREPRAPAPPADRRRRALAGRAGEVPQLPRAHRARELAHPARVLRRGALRPGRVRAPRLPQRLLRDERRPGPGAPLQPGLERR